MRRGPNNSLNFGTSLLAATATVPVLTFVSALMLARLFGPAGRGTIAAVVSMFMLLRYVSTLGGQEAAVVSGNWEGWNLDRSTRAAITWIGPASIAFAIVAWTAAPILFPKDPDAVIALRWLTPLLPLAAVSDGLRYVLTNARRTVPVVAHLLSQPVVRLIGISLLFVLDIDDVLIGAVLCVVGAAVGLLFVAVAVPLRGSLRRFSEGRAYRSLALRLAPGQAASLGSRRLDQVLLSAVAGPSELGIYAVAVAVAEIPDVVTRVLRQLALSDPQSTDGRTLMRHVRAGLLLWIPAAVGILLLINWAIPLLFGADFSAAVAPAAVLIVAGAAAYIRDVLGVHLIVKGRAGLDSIIHAGTMVLAITVIVALGQDLGAMAAAIAALVSYVTGAVAVAVIYVRSSSGDELDLRPTISDLGVLTKRVGQ